MKTIDLSNQGITTPVIRERCYLIKVTEPSTGEVLIFKNKDRLDALKFAFTVAIRKPEYNVYFVGVMTNV